MTMEHLSNSGRMAPRCGRAAKQKWVYYSLWEKTNGTQFYGFCTTSDPGSAHWPQTDENREILFGGPHEKVLQLGTPEKEYVLSLANLIALFIVIPVSYMGQVRSKLVANCTKNLESSGGHEMSLKQLFSDTIHFLLQRTISSFLFHGSSSPWDQSAT